MSIRSFKSGAVRTQCSLLPPSIEEYVGADNPVRAIDAYVEALDLAELGFCHAGGDRGAGQPAYNPGDLLRLYLYGYLNQVRSSRRLEREATRNLEVMWLLRGLAPGYRTIGDFRKNNWAALKAANRDFVLIARELGLFGGTLVAIDGAFFHGNASKASIAPAKRLAEQLAGLDRDIEAYGGMLQSNDAADDAVASADKSPPQADDMAQRLAALMAKRARVQADIAALAESGETQVSHTDSDARLLRKYGQVVAGYNVQIAVDDKHKLIVASEVVNDGNDAGQLHALAQAAKVALEVDALTALADAGYYNGATLKACEDDKIVACVPPPSRTGRLEKQGRFSHENFIYDAQADVYRCPQAAALTPMRGFKTDAAGRNYIRYASRRTACAGCPLRAQCLTDKSDRRTIYRWEHEAVTERHRVRMKDAGQLMRRRSGLAEHPFGTLKCRAGYLHFLVRGFNKVRGEWSLMALCYNLARVLNIIGLDGFKACLAKRKARQSDNLPYPRRHAALRRLMTTLWRAWSAILANNAPKTWTHAIPAT